MFIYTLLPDSLNFVSLHISKKFSSNYKRFLIKNQLQSNNKTQTFQIVLWFIWIVLKSVESAVINNVFCFISLLKHKQWRRFAKMQSGNAQLTIRKKENLKNTDFKRQADLLIFIKFALDHCHLNHIVQLIRYQQPRTSGQFGKIQIPKQKYCLQQYLLRWFSWQIKQVKKFCLLPVHLSNRDFNNFEIWRGTFFLECCKHHKNVLERYQSSPNIVNMNSPIGKRQ